MAISDLTSLITHWKLNEASGNRLDAHGTNTLGDNNTVLQGTGKIGEAADFEALNSEWLSRGIDTDFQLSADEDFTWAVWVKLESKPGNDMYFFHGASGAADKDTAYAIRWDNTGDRFEFVLGDETSAGIEAADNLGAPALATWYLIIVWHDKAANTINIQVNDGTVDSSAWANGTNSTFNGATELGRRSWSGAGTYFDGLLDSVSFWKGRVLTSAERTELYNGGAGLDYPFGV
ncbi:hypothetical protein LCGC14_1387300, partial [marine sediment metagenome]